jgi:hypothetical protein
MDWSLVNVREKQTTLLDLLLMPSDRQGRQAGLEDALRRAVASGQLPRGVRLPSARALASELGCARATVVGATSSSRGRTARRVRGAGTHVAAAPGLAPEAATLRAPVEARRYDADFRPGEPDRGSFPGATGRHRSAACSAPRPTISSATATPRPARAARRLASYLGRSARFAPIRSTSSSSAASRRHERARGDVAHHWLDTIAIEDPALPFHPEFCAARTCGRGFRR